MACGVQTGAFFGMQVPFAGWIASGAFIASVAVEVYFRILAKIIKVPSYNTTFTLKKMIRMINLFCMRDLL